MKVHAKPQKLSELLEGLIVVNSQDDIEITGLTTDSRRVCSGDLFLACSGSNAHGIEYIDAAVKAGAIAIVYDEFIAAEQHSQISVSVPIFGMNGLRKQVGVIASRFYGHPAEKLFIVGVTGTNGKTSCCQYLAQALSTQNIPCGVIGTLGYGVYGDLEVGLHTTPDVVTLQSLLADLKNKDIQYVAMEVSSHGLDQDRVSGIAFDVAIFTNLTHEHLDYHGDIETYAQAKQKLFASPGLRYAVINHDDEFGCELIESLSRQASEKIKVLSYGLQEGPMGSDISQVIGNVTKIDKDGLELRINSPWGQGNVQSNLLGEFNAKNLLAVLSTLLLMGIPLEDALVRLSKTKPVPGRMEHFSGDSRQPLVVVDYAHTPDALKQVLMTLREHSTGTLWCVFGCGGDRDRAKRPLMGAIAEQLADHVIITDDNPRNEDAQQIAANILTGMNNPDKAHVLRDRAQAITHAIQHATGNDVVLIAGKGHEEYQLVGDQKIIFSDRKQVNNVLKEVA